MQYILVLVVALTIIFTITPADADRHGSFGTLPIGKKVTVKCFNGSGPAYEKTGWFLVSFGSGPDNIILSENPKEPESGRTAVITLSGSWDCVIETM